MNTIEPDDRGLIRACPNCGQRNRLIYERLGSIFRCTKCGTEIFRADGTDRGTQRAKIRFVHRSIRAAGAGGFLGAVVWPL